MEENQYSLRSREVQEVLSTAPRRLIIWGNIVISSCFLLFLVLLQYIRTPIKVKMDTIITKVSFDNNCLKIQAYVESLKSYKIAFGNTVAMSSLMKNSGGGPINGKIQKIDLSNDLIYISAESNNDAVFSKFQKVESFNKPSRWQLEVNTGTISALSLFKDKLFK